MGTCTHDIDFIADKVRSHISPIHISSCPRFIFPPYQIQGSIFPPIFWNQGSIFPPIFLDFCLQGTIFPPNFILANLTKLQLSVHMSNSHLELD